MCLHRRFSLWTFEETLRLRQRTKIWGVSVGLMSSYRESAAAQLGRPQLAEILTGLFDSTLASGMQVLS
jgi:hypothetical protein